MLAPIKLCIIGLIVMHYLIKSMVSGILVPVEESYTVYQQIIHILVVYGSLLGGLFVIMKNGRKFIDDASRFV